MDYGRLLSRAWELCWNNKFLFLLGFLAALGSGGGSGNFNTQFSEQNLPPGFSQNFERIIENIAPILVVVLCIGLLIGLALWLLRLIGQAGLIHATVRLDDGETATFGSAFSAGTGYLLRFVGITILLYLPVWILGLLSLGGFVASFFPLIGAGVAGEAGGGGAGALAAGGGLLMLCAIALCCILIPVWIVLIIIYAFAQRGIVVSNLGAVGSIRHAWRLIVGNAGDVVLLVVLLGLLSLVYGVAIGLVLTPLALLVAGPLFFTIFTGGTPGLAQFLILIVGGVLVGIVGAILNALLVTYRSVIVTLAYREFLARLTPKAV